MVGFTSPMPLVIFRTPPISVSATLSETLQLPFFPVRSVTHQSGTNTVTRRDEERRMHAVMGG